MELLFGTRSETWASRASQGSQFRGCTEHQPYSSIKVPAASHCPDRDPEGVPTKAATDFVLSPQYQQLRQRMGV